MRCASLSLCSDAISIKNKDIYLHVRQQKQWNEKFFVIPLLFSHFKNFFMFVREVVLIHQPNYVNGADDHKFRIYSPVFK